MYCWQYDVVDSLTNKIMDRYFEDMLPVEELEQLKFIPTISEFVEWIQERPQT